MKRQLIQMTQDYLVQCDTPGCGYTIPNPTKDPCEDTKQYINMPCPKCGANLLTQKDYDDAMKFLRGIMWLNKWFGWLSYLSPKNKKKEMHVHVHDGEVNITQN